MDKIFKDEIWPRQGSNLDNSGAMQLYYPLHQRLLMISYQILGKLGQLKSICNKGVYRNKWYFYNKSKLF